MIALTYENFRQLVSSITLGIALRYVLEALRKPLRSNMFKFGMCALEQFKQRLVEWPQYCHHILHISHIRQSHSELIQHIQTALQGRPMVGEGGAAGAGGQQDLQDQHPALALAAPGTSAQFAMQGGQAGGTAGGMMQASQLDQQLLRAQV
jgi:hypothetical protein